MTCMTWLVMMWMSFILLAASTGKSQSHHRPVTESSCYENWTETASVDCRCTEA